MDSILSRNEPSDKPGTIHQQGFRAAGMSMRQLLAGSCEHACMESSFKRFGFLPDHEPAKAFRRHPEFEALDELAHDLPSLLHDRSFRTYAGEMDVPRWPASATGQEDRPEMRLYYVRLGFLA